ncbi:MAG: tRNA (adenosine(37)-N6)-threonylcarbamoyltransferase complex dimerization subunit type 1 TsaB, partial [Actinomycetales bacterium]
MAVPVVLALDTASAVTSVALVSAGTVVEQSHADPRGHAEVVIPLVRAVLTKSATTLPEIIACGVGPGPYTGLRVGIATARALALSWSVPLVGVCSLDAVAWAA